MGEDLREKVLKYVGTRGHARNRDIAQALNEDKKVIDKIVAELTSEDKLEYRSFGGVTEVATK